MACEWLTHAGKALREGGRKANASELDEQEANMLKAGDLFRGGKPGLSEERWQFWRERLVVLGDEAGDAGLKERVGKTAKGMEG